MAEDIFSRLRAAIPQLQNLSNQEVAIDRQKAAGYTQLGLDKAEQVQQEGDLELSRQAKAQDIARGLGVNPDQGGDILYKLGQEYQRQQEIRRQAFDAYTEKQSVGFLQNPIQYIINQSTIDSDIDTFNNATVRADMASRQMQETNAMAQQGAVTAQAVGTKVTASTLATKARIESADATQKSLDAQRQAIADQSLGMEKVLQLGVQQQHLLFQAAEKKRAEENQEWTRQMHAMQLEEFGRKKEMWKAEDAFNDLEFQKIQAGHLARTGQALPEAMAPMVRAMLKSPKGPTGEFAQDLFIGGNVQGAPGSIATSPSDLLRLTQTVGYTWRPGQEGVQQIMRDGEQYVGSIISKGEMDELDPATGKMKKVPISGKDHEKIRALFDNYVNGRVAQDFKDASATSAGKPNLAAVPDLATIVKATPALLMQQANAIVLKPLLDAKVNADPNTVWDAYMAAVADRKVPLQDAVEGYALIYQRGTLLSNASRNLAALGLRLPEAGRTFNYSLPGGQIINRADIPTMMRQAARDLGKRARGGANPYASGYGDMLAPWSDMAPDPRQLPDYETHPDRVLSGNLDAHPSRRAVPIEPPSLQSGQGKVGGTPFERSPGKHVALGVNSLYTLEK